MVPRSFHFPKLELRALCVWYMILAPFYPILAYLRTPERTIYSNKILLQMHIFSYKHFYFTSSNTSKKMFINRTEWVQWGMAWFMNIRSWIFFYFLLIWGYLELNNCHVLFGNLNQFTFFQYWGLNLLLNTLIFITGVYKT